jgi:hypothetical protein
MEGWAMRGRWKDHPDALRYSDMRKTIASADVLLYEGETFFSWIIKKVTRSRFSHAGIAVWWNERLMVMEAVRLGVVVTPLSASVGHYKGHVHWYTSKRLLGEKDRERMIIFAQEELGKAYALWKAIWVGIKLVFNWKPEERDELKREQKLFCSAYVAQIYNSIGVDLVPGRSDIFVVPEDIASSRELLHQGVLKTLSLKRKWKWGQS